MCVYSLRGNHLGAAGAGALAEALKLNAVMNTITLDGFGNGFPLPVKQLKGTEPVEALDFSNKGLGALSAIVIGKLIEFNAVLTDLNLGANQLCGINPYTGEGTYDPSGIQALAAALSSGSAVLTTIECVFRARTRESRHNSCTHVFSSRARSHQYHGFRPMCPFA